MTIATMLIAVMVTAALAYVFDLGARHRSATNARVDQLVAQIARYENAQIAYATQGSDLATFYAIRGDSYAQGFERSAAQTDQALAAAAAAAPGGSSDQAQAQELLSSYRSVADAEERVLRAVQRDDIATALKITGETGLIDASPKLTDDLQRTVDDARTGLSAAQSADATAQQRSFKLSMGIAAAWAIFLLTLGLASFRWLARPLERVRLATQAIARGAVETRVRESGPRELADVGADVNRMADALIRRSEELNGYLSKNLEARTVELEEANAALGTSEERFRSLVQNSSDMITTVDATGMPLYASPSVEQIMGYSSEDWVGTNVLDLIHPDDRARAATSLAGVVQEAGVHPPIELRVRHRDGAYRYLEMVANNLLDDPAVRAVVHNSRDVTQRRQMEEALRESERRFRSLAEHSPVGIYQITPQRQLVYLNPAGLAIIEADDMEAMTQVPFEQIFTAESLETMRVEHAKRALGTASIYEVEALGLRGTRRNLLVSGAPLLNAEGEVQALVGTMVDITERKLSEEALRKREEEFRLLFADNPHPMWVYDIETLRFLEVNDAAVENYGYSRAEFLAMRITEIRPKEDISALVASLGNRPTLQRSGEWRHRRRDGEIIDVEITSHITEFAGRSGALVVALDVTERTRAQHALEASEERFRSLVHHASDLITVIRADTTVLYQSPSIEGVLGYQADAVIGHPLTDIVHPDDVTSVLAFLAQTVSKPDASASVEARLLHQDGAWRVFEIVGSDRTGDPAIGGFVLNTRDLSERKLLEDQLRDQAFRDPLTKLANRARFSDRLDHALERSREKDAKLAVLFINLDNFKAVNDSFGHAAGDQILSEVAARLRLCLRPGDTAARFGGDEFAILAEDLGASELGIRLGERIVDEVRKPFEIDGRQLFIGASVGVTEAGAEQRGDDIVRNADVAMYVAKSRGKSRCESYDPSMHAAMARRLELIADLQRALELCEFVLEYQPTVVLATGELSGVEALVRWEHPERGRIMPSEFIPLAEESGAIGALGHWVLVTACQQARRWAIRYGDAPALSMNVNVSVRQLQQPAFVDEVASVLRETEMRPDALVLEVTESVMMQDVDAIVPVLEDLKGLGVRLAIDDFGTGYSSLSYLAQFPFDILKIDKSFVDGAETEGSKLDLTRAIIELGKTLHLEIVAEGIEREGQAVELRRLSCDVGQGYLFARPLSVEQFERLLEKARGEAAA